MKKSLCIALFLLFFSQIVYADCWDQARDFRDRLQKGRDSLEESCGEIEKDASDIIGKCSGQYKCNSIHYMEDTLYYAKECYRQVPYTDPSINLFDNCQSAFDSLNSYGKKLSQAQDSRTKAIEAYKNFFAENK